MWPSVIGPDNTIYFWTWIEDGRVENRIFALSLDNTVKWTTEIEYAFGCTVAENGISYFGSGSYRLYALDSEGSIKWAFRAGGEAVRTPTIGLNNTIYFTSSDNKLYAVNPDNTLKWTWNFGETKRVITDLAIGTDGTTYFSSDNTLYAIYDNGDRATLRWSFSAHDDIYTSPSVGDDGTIYIGSKDGNFYALNPGNGDVKWVFEAGDVDSSAAIAADGTIYFAASEDVWDKWLYALNPDGTLKWRRKIGLLLPSDPIVDANGTVYIVSGDSLYAINPDNTLKWSYRFGEGVPIGSPVIGSDGVIYFAATKTLYAIGTPVEQPPTDNTLLIAAGAVIAVIALFTALFYLKRIRK